MSIKHKTDILIIGAGIIGLTIARQLVQKGVKSITILEKEAKIGCHASGRNSGILHAGIYYPQESLKAKYCLQGNRLLKTYCKEKNLPLFPSGKIIVPTTADELETLYLLFQRAKENGAHVALINHKKLSELEPQASCYQEALYSTETATVDPQSILRALAMELSQHKNVKFLYSQQLLGITGQIAHTNIGDISFDYLINAAGAYADKIAHMFNIAKHLSLMPFKGLYRKIKHNIDFHINGNIYPVPDLAYPFLGVHFSRNIHGDIYVGPTAIPAFGRENYGIVKGLDSELLSIFGKNMRLLRYNRQLRQAAFNELKKYNLQSFFNDARRLVKDLRKEWFTPVVKSGIRPQLVDWDKYELVNDFTVLNTPNSMHILNAISPAFTSSLAMAIDLTKKVL